MQTKYREWLFRKIKFLRHHLKDLVYLCGRQEMECKPFSLVMNETVCQLLGKLHIIVQANLKSTSNTVVKSGHDIKSKYC